MSSFVDTNAPQSGQNQSHLGIFLLAILLIPMLHNRAKRKIVPKVQLYDLSRWDYGSFLVCFVLMVNRFGILLVLSVKRLYNRLSLLRCIPLHCLPDIHQYSLWTKNKQDICTLNFYRIKSETSTNILLWTKQARAYPK